MEKLELFPKQLKPFLHLLDEGHMATGYVVEGDDKVCVIDTMNGYTDIKSYIRKFTDKPIVVVNTHGHPDHIFGNVYFDEALLNPKDLELAESFVNLPEFVDACKKYNLRMPPFKPVREGDVIDLGGKTLEVYELPGHTAGGIVQQVAKSHIREMGGIEKAEYHTESPHKDHFQSAEEHQRQSDDASQTGGECDGMFHLVDADPSLCSS